MFFFCEEVRNILMFMFLYKDFMFKFILRLFYVCLLMNGLKLAPLSNKLPLKLILTLSVEAPNLKALRKGDKPLCGLYKASTFFSLQ